MPGRYTMEDDGRFGGALGRTIVGRKGSGLSRLWGAGGPLGRMIAPGRLGSFWDDLYNAAGKVQQAAIAGREMKAGNIKVAVVPTQQGAINYTREAVSNNVPMLVLGAGAVLAVVLAMQNQGRRRR